MTTLGRMAFGGVLAVVLAVGVAVAFRPADAVVDAPAVGGVSLDTDGRGCADRPVLDTVRPVLAFVGGSPPYLASTFQVRGLLGHTERDVDLPGEPDARGATLDFKRAGALAHGVSYRWRVRPTSADDWSPWCEFTVAASTPDDLGLDESRTYTVTLPGAEWRAVAEALGAVETYAPITAAGESGSGRVAVSLRGQHWRLVVEGLAYWGSQHRDAAVWRLADLLSAELGGPAHPTMGFPRD
ncbi:hypothetical protein ACQP00_32935 [Dactylosporangium sp. CS-047395]|uniref:hypothetical protein n=1 Tax=Dactylosporangium sp. CS-047395 TaxID=3239936 RepID=UPI003D8B06DD